MHAAMDLNNEKIQMRKEIKRAKVWVTSKLVRQIRNLQSKKGNEVMITKNKRRARRLEDELDIIKDLKPDDVFKQLIDSPVVGENSARPQLTLHERAMIRIGSISFIKTKMTDIKSNVSAFHQLRSSKDTSAVNSKIDDAVRRSPVCQNTVTESKAENDSERLTKLTDGGEVSINNSVSDEVILHKKIATSNNDVISPICDDACVPHSDEDEIPSGMRNDIAEIESQELSTATPIEDRADHKPDFQEIAKGYDDITQVLTNIGDGFNSDDSGKGSDIELEDLIKPSGKDDSSSKVQDIFFLNCAGTVNKKCEDGSKAGASHSSDDEGLKQVKSCFVESLASVSHQRNKGNYFCAWLAVRSVTKYAVPFR